ncbi:GntR family transcriptional regulator [Georgenia sp. EYE_87]|uniref:GntR family transcriptional regulator n=1 Tax=Georgenia sp. EYE_87 TaxID=2853448 RepID=UPI002005439C|nr:GntR family transcriptional regulator [Georgenia sp. EYE_87]MCK6211085.1 GntR family transcriptional regulator [Georgenia sp. EYE_87]
MTIETSATTRGSRVHEQLRADIISGRYAPGTPLRLAALAAQFKVSMSVVREALIRLAEQNLVMASPNQGFRVVPISRDDLVDLTDLRVTIECLALERSIDAGDTQWEATVVSSHHVLERTDMTAPGIPGTTEEWSRAHAAFHDALGAGCGSPRLIQITHSLRDSAEMYRQLSGGRTHEGGRDIAAEHRELMELATGRQPAAASAALERHIRRTTEALLEFVFPGDPAPAR